MPQAKAIGVEQEAAPMAQDAAVSAESAAAGTATADLPSIEAASPPPAAPRSLVAPAEETPGIAAVAAPPAVEAAAEAVAGAGEETPEIAAMSMTSAMSGGKPPGIPENWTPEPAPPAVSPRDIFGPADGIIYALPDGLRIVDGNTEPRLIKGSAGGVSPLISPDRRWVVYRVPSPEYTELWVASWDGKNARLLLADQDLPIEDLDAGYTTRRLGELSWIPGKNQLAITTFAIPSGAQASLALPKFDLWTLDVETGALRYILELSSSQSPFYAPDGQQFALFEFSITRDAQNSMSVFSADGTIRKTMLRLPDGIGTVGHLVLVQWLPDNNGLLATAPAAAVTSNGNMTITFFRLLPEADPVATGQIEAMEFVWAPNGEWLVYLRRNATAPDKLDLMLATGDGANPMLYTSFRFGAFLGWAPDSQHFLYQVDGLVYLGSPDDEPQVLGNSASVFDPRWLTSDRIIYLMDQGADWMLVSRDLTGEAASLLSLPRDVSYTATQR
jgi:hypothetical protein